MGCRLRTKQLVARTDGLHRPCSPSDFELAPSRPPLPLQFQLDSGAWLPYHPTSTDRYDLQQRMGYASPGSCIEGIFFATIQVAQQLL